MRYRFSQPEDYGDRNARLAGEGWSGRDAKRNPRRQPDGPPLREDGKLARRFPVVKPSTQDIKP